NVTPLPPSPVTFYYEATGIIYFMVRYVGKATHITFLALKNSCFLLVKVGEGNIRFLA
ncbi:MAG: hypothetical protein FD151_1943, partial [bacterium]